MTDTNAAAPNDRDDAGLDDTKTLQEALDEASDEQVGGFVKDLERIARERDRSKSE